MFNYFVKYSLYLPIEIQLVAFMDVLTVRFDRNNNYLRNGRMARIPE